MKEIKFNCIRLAMLCLVLFASCYTAKGSEDPIRSVELKLLWEKSVDFEYGLIIPDPDFKRFVATKSLGKRNDRYVYLNGACEKIFAIQSSKYGKGPGRTNLYYHPHYIRAKKDDTLSELNLVVTDFVVPSQNYNYLGVFQMYYTNKTDRFDRRFKFYEIDAVGNRKLLWEKDPSCPDLLTKKQTKEIIEPGTAVWMSV